MKHLDYRNNPIGFFDSGVGGISVLKKAIEIMPNENYIYYGDSKNAPYGIKSVEEVRALSFNAVEYLLNKGAKAVVIACNTATSAAAQELRSKYSDIPIIGIEPAVKPAVESNKDGKIIIMATPMTLSKDKFISLMHKYDNEREIVPLPAPGLVEFIEKGILNGEELNKFIAKLLKPYLDQNISTIVLGCTHYPFVKDIIQEVVGKNVDIIDGSLGTVKELKRRLGENLELNNSNKNGSITIYNSLEDDRIINLSKQLLDM